MSHTYLTIEELSKIEMLIQEGYKINHIAKASQADAYQLATHKGRKAKHMSKLLETIQHKLELTWSPEQIMGRDYQGKLLFKTIYNWIYKGVLNVPLKVLRHKNKKWPTSRNTQKV